VAISSDAESFAWSMSQTTGAKYQILSDGDRQVIKSYGVFNPAEHDGIAHPSVFIIDKGGRVRYAYVGKNPTDRPPDEAIIEALKKITADK
jgi:peroxiredoxin